MHSPSFIQFLLFLLKTSWYCFNSNNKRVTSLLNWQYYFPLVKGTLFQPLGPRGDFLVPPCNELGGRYLVSNSSVQRNNYFGSKLTFLRKNKIVCCCRPCRLYKDNVLYTEHIKVQDLFKFLSSVCSYQEENNLGVEYSF